MSASILNPNVAKMVQSIELTSFTWDGVPVRVPVFSVYAIIQTPLITRSEYQNNKLIPIIELDKYTIPIVDPFGDVVEHAPNFAVVISQLVDNQFGLFAYPADHIEDNIVLSYAQWLETKPNIHFYQA
jgi:hypothetical protein